MKIVERVRGEDGRCESRETEVKMVVVSQDSQR